MKRKFSATGYESVQEAWYHSTSTFLVQILLDGEISKRGRCVVGGSSSAG
jgi:hypothetical protein